MRKGKELKGKRHIKEGKTEKKEKRKTRKTIIVWRLSDN